MEGELRGKLLNKNKEEESKLKGKLLNNLEEEKILEMYSEEWLKRQVLIQRDGGGRFEVKNIVTQTMGSLTGARVVQLISLKDGHTFNSRFNILIEKIKTPGGAWFVEQNLKTP